MTIVGAGLALMSAGFAYVAVQNNDGSPRVHGVEHLALFAMPNRSREQKPLSPSGNSPAAIPLVEGDIRFLDAPEPVLAFVREGAGQRLLVAFNLSDAAVHWRTDALAGTVAATGHGLPGGQVDGRGLSLPPYGAYYATWS